MGNRLRHLAGFVAAWVAAELLGDESPSADLGGARPEPKWPGEEFNGARYASVSYFLIKNEAHWIHRRVEKLELLDKGRLRRQMSLDLTAPTFDGDEIRYVPLSLVRKQILRDFDVRSQDGQPLSILTREQNGPIAAAILVGNARLTLEAPDKLPAAERQLSEGIREDLEAIVGTTHVAAQVRAAAFGRLTRPDPNLPDYSQRLVLACDENMLADIVELYEQFILFVDMPMKAEERRVIKFSYEHSLRPWPNLFVRALRTPVYLLEGVGILPFRTRILAQAALDSRSYHVDVEAPEEVFFARARLRARRKEEMSWWKHLRGRDLDLLDAEHGVDSVHLYGFAVSPRLYSLAILDLDISLRPGGLLVAGFLSSLATTMILWAGIFLHGRGVTSDRTEVTSLLVVLPAIFAAFLIPGEHPLTRRMFRGLRLLLLLTAAMAFAAAALLALNLTKRPPVDLWFVHFRLSTLQGWRYLGWTSLGVTALTFASLSLAWLRRHVLPVMRKKPLTSD